MQPIDYNQLFARYIAICNDALNQNADKFPFKQILQSVRTREADELVDVQIIDDYFTPHFRLKIGQDRVTAVPTCKTKQGGGCCGGCKHRQWNVPASYLRQVTDNPEAYIANPALINWEWLHDA